MSNPLRVLVIDDSALMRKLITQVKSNNDTASATAITTRRPRRRWKSRSDCAPALKARDVDDTPYMIRCICRS